MRMKRRGHTLLKLLIILVSIGMAFGVNMLSMLIVEDEGNLGQIILADFTEMMALGLIIFIWGKFLPRQFPATNDYRFRKPAIYQVLMVIGIALISLVGGYRLLYVFRGGDVNVTMIPIAYESAAEFKEEMMASIHAILIAPTLEEMCFRIIPASVVQTNKKRIVVLAILAILFAALHRNNFLAAWGDATVFIVLFIVTRNPLIPILCHAFSNLFKTLAGMVSYIGLMNVSMSDGGALIVLFSTPVTIGLVVIGAALVMPVIIHLLHKEQAA